jgi:hypothetical protein
MYQNRLGPSGGIYYPNFVPCFVVVQLNWPQFYEFEVPSGRNVDLSSIILISTRS